MTLANNTLMDIALIASVPQSALRRNRVRQSARRLLATPAHSDVFAADPTPRRSTQQTFRALCKKLLTRGALTEEEAGRIQDLATSLLDDVSPRPQMAC
ncbi:hypothetical protein ROJ8625_02793 [Roseivivax jejudonensis]|uniref:Uncharacterized protein n=1 Tax=Roseivivax jejudonensis TaxID=1529041 RepID=A0A1X6ZMV4_9RHOB|nr:hypothetical protein [Roseivivax jejudonensis]SLN55687.1 hypothetical protein ROJ8625_02793 [Roseivivax jejudonensis]